MILLHAQESHVAVHQAGVVQCHIQTLIDHAFWVGPLNPAAIRHRNGDISAQTAAGERLSLREEEGKIFVKYVGPGGLTFDDPVDINFQGTSSTSSSLESVNQQACRCQLAGCAKFRIMLPVAHPMQPT